MCDIEHGTFTPLVMPTGGGFAKEALVFFKRLAGLISVKRDLPYSIIMGWMRCALSFRLLKSSILCLRGTRRVNWERESIAPSSDTIIEAAAGGRLPAL